MAREGAGERLRRERRIWRMGLLLSVLLHLTLFLIFHTTQERLTPHAAAGPPSGDPVAAPGGGGMRAITLRPPVEITVPPRPETPVIEPVEIQPTEEPQLALNEVELRDPGESLREGPESGEGLPGGEGGGDAGDAMSGLRRLIPPTPRGVIMAPLDRPAAVRGREVGVWVYVTEFGAVDSVRLEPATPDSEYNRELIREARDWVFEPAMRAGHAVGHWFYYSWKL